MKPSEQIFARAERMRKRGHRAYAMFLRRDAKMVAQLEAENEALQKDIEKYRLLIVDCPTCYETLKLLHAKLTRKDES